MAAFTHALGWALVNSLWQMGLLWLLFQVLSTFSNRLSPARRHNIALLSLFAGSVWFLIGFFSGISKTDGLSLAAGLDVNENMPAFWSIKLAMDKIVPFLSALYIIILLYFSSRHFLQWVGLREIRNDASAQTQVSFQAFCDSFADRMNIKRPVRLRISKIIDSPLTIGFLKPLIFLPLATVNHLTTEQVETILLHELAHIRRNDYLSNVFVSLAATCFFFNPFAKIFVRIIQEEREHDCDDRVLSLITDPYKYASALLSLEKGRQDFPFALGATSRGDGFLLLRIKRLMGIQFAYKKHRIQWPWFFFSTLLLLVFLVFGLPLRPHQPLISNNTRVHQGGLLAQTGGTGKPKHKKPAHSHAKPVPNRNEIMDTSSDQFSDPVWVTSRATTRKSSGLPMSGFSTDEIPGGRRLKMIQTEYPDLTLAPDPEYSKGALLSNQASSSSKGELIFENNDLAKTISLASIYKELTDLKMLDWSDLDNDSLSNLYTKEALAMDSAWVRMSTLFPINFGKMYSISLAVPTVTSSFGSDAGKIIVSPAIQLDNMIPAGEAGSNSNKESLRRHWQKHYIQLMKKIELIQKIMAPGALGRKIVYI